MSDLIRALRLLAETLLTSHDDDDVRGLRVIRGPDWKWNLQDGGAGCMGTVEGSKGGHVSVIWDNGHKNLYRAGAEGCFDLRIMSNGPAGVKHRGVTCDACKQENVKGIRWECQKCDDYDLCSSCYHSDKHTLSHPFWRFESRSSERVSVDVRMQGETVELKGLFKNATVQRGEDWKYGDQDGGEGNEGKVSKTGNSESTYDSMATVTWKNGQENGYRVGHNGFVDLKCTKYAAGGTCYYKHLPTVNVTSSRKNMKGLRVVRGPDWSDGDEDGGEGRVGTVELCRAGRRVQVRWDAGNAGIYKIGSGGKYDLRVVDSSPVGVEHAVSCTSCRSRPIKGIRWQCHSCETSIINLCTSCYNADKHDTSHRFSRHDGSSSAGVLVSARKGERSMDIRGIFSGAVVRRGQDWKWDDQDGGEGKLGDVVGFGSNEPARSWVNVKWRKENVFQKLFKADTIYQYRLGYKGFVDLKYVQDASGGPCYLRHLQVLGAEGGQADQNVDEEARNEDEEFAQEADEGAAAPDAVPADHGEYYYKDLTGSEAAKKLRAPGIREGTYLLRDSESKKDALTLAVRHDGDKVSQYRVERDGETFAIGTGSFKTMRKLVQHFSLPGGRSTVPQLRYALVKDSEAAAYESRVLSSDVWDITSAALRVTKKSLGKGSFGEVYLGELGGSLKVAVKTLNKGALMDQNDFLKEADVMKTMDHTNVIQLLGVRSKPFQIIMEYASHGSILHYMKRNGDTLDIGGLRKLASDVACGMAYLESRDYVHRDLAGRNVLVCSGSVAKVSDFGMLRHLEENNALQTAGTNLFNVLWAPPEVIVDHCYSTKSDVWSFGVLLTEITTLGEIPYKGMHILTVLSEVCNGYRMQRPSGPLPCPDDLYNIMTRC